VTRQFIERQFIDDSISFQEHKKATYTEYFSYFCCSDPAKKENKNIGNIPCSHKQHWSENNKKLRLEKLLFWFSLRTVQLQISKAFFMNSGIVLHVL